MVSMALTHDWRPLSHQPGRNAKGRRFVRYELTPEKSFRAVGDIPSTKAQARYAGVESSRISSDTRTAAPSGARFTKFLPSIGLSFGGVGSASLVEQAAANRDCGRVSASHCFAMTKSPASLFSDRMISNRYFAIIFEKPACGLNHPVPEIAGNY